MPPVETLDFKTILCFIEQHEKIISILLRIATLALVVIGWWVVDRRNNKRETRKECRGAIAQCSEAIDNTIDSARQYHTGEAHDSQLSSRIRFQIQRVATHLKALDAIGIKVANRHLSDFRKSITLNNFDSETLFLKQELNGEIVDDIEQTGCALTEALEHAFYQTFKP